MHPQTHYGHFIAAIELFTGIFSMSLMTGLIFARFSRPNARLLFADHPVISSHDGEQTLMIRLANERHNIIGNATAQAVAVQEYRQPGRPVAPPVLRTAAGAKREPRAGVELDALPRHRREEPALRSSRRRPRSRGASRWSRWCPAMMLLRRKPSMPANPTIIPTFALGIAMPIFSALADDGRLRIDYGKFHETVADIVLHRVPCQLCCENPGRRAKVFNRDVPELAAVKSQQPIASDDEHRVLQFRPRPRPHSPAYRVGQTTAAGRFPAPCKRPVALRTGSLDEPDDFRQRMLANLAAVAFTVALMAVGIWLTMNIAGLRKTQDCVLMGRRDCAHISAP